MSEEPRLVGSGTMGGKKVESAMASQTGDGSGGLPGFQSRGGGSESKSGGLRSGCGDWRRVLSERRSRGLERMSSRQRGEEGS